MGTARVTVTQGDVAQGRLTARMEQIDVGREGSGSLRRSQPDTGSES